MGSADEHNNWDKHQQLQPIMYTGSNALDLIEDLICFCDVCNTCQQQCVYFEQNLNCTELYSREGSKDCHNTLTKIEVEDELDHEADL